MSSEAERWISPEDGVKVAFSPTAPFPRFRLGGIIMLWLCKHRKVSHFPTGTHSLVTYFRNVSCANPIASRIWNDTMTSMTLRQ